MTMMVILAQYLFGHLCDCFSLFREVKLKTIVLVWATFYLHSFGSLLSGVGFKVGFAFVSNNYNSVNVECLKLQSSNKFLCYDHYKAKKLKDILAIKTLPLPWHEVVVGFPGPGLGQRQGGQ